MAANFHAKFELAILRMMYYQTMKKIDFLKDFNGRVPSRGNATLDSKNSSYHYDFSFEKMIREIINL